MVVQDLTERVQLQDDLEAARERLQELALHDPLTGLPNRSYLSHQLGASLRGAARAGGHTAVLSVDLDGFKAANDPVGHRADDQLLVAVAERITATVRPLDFAARSVATSSWCAAPSRAPAEPLATADQPWTLGASIGIALARGDEASPTTCSGRPTPTCTG